MRAQAEFLMRAQTKFPILLQMTSSSVLKFLYACQRKLSLSINKLISTFWFCFRKNFTEKKLDEQVFKNIVAYMICNEYLIFFIMMMTSHEFFLFVHDVDGFFFSFFFFVFFFFQIVDQCDCDCYCSTALNVRSCFPFHSNVSFSNHVSKLSFTYMHLKRN